MKRACYFLDTNVLIRLLVCDNPGMVQQCLAIFQQAEQGFFDLVSSEFVLQEVVFVLDKFYRVEKMQLLEAVESLCAFEHITFLKESPDFLAALQLWKNSSLQFGDCLISTQVQDDVVLCTFDTDFQKTAHIQTISPAELLKKV